MKYSFVLLMTLAYSRYFANPAKAEVVLAMLVSFKPLCCASCGHHRVVVRRLGRLGSEYDLDQARWGKPTPDRHRQSQCG